MDEAIAKAHALTEAYQYILRFKGKTVVDVVVPLTVGRGPTRTVDLGGAPRRWKRRPSFPDRP